MHTHLFFIGGLSLSPGNLLSQGCPCTISGPGDHMLPTALCTQMPLTLTPLHPAPQRSTRGRTSLKNHFSVIPKLKKTGCQLISLSLAPLTSVTLDCYSSGRDWIQYSLSVSQAYKFETTSKNLNFLVILYSAVHISHASALFVRMRLIQHISFPVLPFFMYIKNIFPIKNVSALRT